MWSRMRCLHYTGAESLNKKWGGLIFMGCNCVHVSIPARGIWRHAPQEISCISGPLRFILMHFERSNNNVILSHKTRLD